MLDDAIGVVWTVGGDVIGGDGEAGEAKVEGFALEGCAADMGGVLGDRAGAVGAEGGRMAREMESGSCRGATRKAHGLGEDGVGVGRAGPVLVGEL